MPQTIILQPLAKPLDISTHLKSQHTWTEDELRILRALKGKLAILISAIARFCATTEGHYNAVQDIRVVHEHTANLLNKIFRAIRLQLQNPQRRGTSLLGLVYQIQTELRALDTVVMRIIQKDKPTAAVGPARKIIEALQSINNLTRDEEFLLAR